MNSSLLRRPYSEKISFNFLIRRRGTHCVSWRIPKPPDLTRAWKNSFGTFFRRCSQCLVAPVIAVSAEFREPSDTSSKVSFWGLVTNELLECKDVVEVVEIEWSYFWISSLIDSGCYRTPTCIPRYLYDCETSWNIYRSDIFGLQLDVRRNRLSSVILAVGFISECSAFVWIDSPALFIALSNCSSSLFIPMSLVEKQIVGECDVIALGRRTSRPSLTPLIGPIRWLSCLWPH